jgi:hypothetical protein
MSIPNDQFEKYGFAPNFAICANKFLCAGKFFTSSLNSYPNLLSCKPERLSAPSAEIGHKSSRIQTLGALAKQLFN